MFLKDAKRFTVKRSQWLHGGGDDTKIIDENGKKDCIGFFLEASGLDSSQMVGCDEPIDIFRKSDWNTRLVKECGNVRFQSEICRQIIITNDAKAISQAEREEQLIKLFAAIDVTLTFED